MIDILLIPPSPHPLPEMESGLRVSFPKSLIMALYSITPPLYSKLGFDKLPDIK
jgi:hypothetical protein